MKGLTDSEFKLSYFKTDEKGQEKLVDHFQTRKVKLLPFTLNPLSGNLYDNTCGLLGVASEFYRLYTKSAVKPIDSIDDTIAVLRAELKGQCKMADDDIDRFVEVFKDILFENNKLNVIDPEFFAFAPMSFFDKQSKGIKRYNKYRAGQSKIANYYLSMTDLEENVFGNAPRDLFSQTIINCLKKEEGFSSSTADESYFILPFVKASFAKDLKWLVRQNSPTVVKYLPLFLHFYACYSLIQTLVFMNKNNWNTSISEPRPIYYMLTTEKVTASADGVRKGWSASNLLADTFLDKMSSYAQALDILNLLFEDNEGLMTYQEIKERFAAMEWDEEAKVFCESILYEYQSRKRTLLKDRGTETNALPAEIDINVNSYDDFMDILLELCIKLQSKDYPRMKHAMYSMADIRLLMRRREHKVLAFDEELLLFLIAMVTKGERIRLEELYKRLATYGILFSFQTKNAISEYLLNLNLLERKSDSGDAQYVRIVL